MFVDVAEEEVEQVKRWEKRRLREEKKKHMHDSDLQRCEGTKDGRDEKDGGCRPGRLAELVAAASRCLCLCLSGQTS